MSISAKIRAVVDAIIYHAVSVMPAHVTAMDRRDQAGLTWRRCRPLEEARGGASDRVLQNSSEPVSSHYESYIYTARSRTEVSRDVLLVWVALMNTAQHLSHANPGGVKSPSKS